MEIIILVLSMLLTDGSYEHVGVRAFTSMDECTKFLPAYQELIGKFNNPGNIRTTAISCYKPTPEQLGE